MRYYVRATLNAMAVAWADKPWLHWLVAYGIIMSYFFFYRLHVVGAILDMFASAKEHNKNVKSGGMFLGIFQDFAITTILMIVLLAVDLLAKAAYKRLGETVQQKIETPLRAVLPVARFIVSFVLVALTLTPFAADLLLIRTRQLRFTMGFITMYFREKDEAANLKIDDSEIRMTKETVAATVIIVTFFSAVYTIWVDLTLWITKSNERPAVVTHPAVNGYETIATSELSPTHDIADAEYGLTHRKLHVVETSPTKDQDLQVAGVTKHETVRSGKRWYQRKRSCVAITLAFAYIMELLITGAISHSVPVATASVALNMTLNELFRCVLGLRFEPEAKVTLPPSSGGDAGTNDGKDKGPSADSSSGWSVRQYLNSDTEEYKLEREDVLYRKTTGFKGPLAFDVAVDPKNPPNVLVLVVESFRYSDSLYMAGNLTAAATITKEKYSVTPAYDRWAKRGIAFTNMWSSWQTSRSVESINFAQLPYDSNSMTGMTGGRVDTQLSGLPHLFKQKGYETIFTTGCTVKYDQWDSFLSSHGYESVLGEPDIQALAMKDLHLNGTEWRAGRRSLNWGVHDDASFIVLGNLLLNKTKEQQARVAKGKPKKPVFINHYTISSHIGWDQVPKWFDTYPVPDFSALYTGKGNANMIKNYNTLRFFTDLELGKFMDRMEENGILNDTIVVMLGDHGISPEQGASQMYVDQVACTRVPMAIVAEGRLGQYAGMKMHDPVEQYDILNTLADITGLPPNGFMQTGVGRSLKRKIPENERIVWSNNPLKKKSAIKGTKRFVYDSVSDAVTLHDADVDPYMTDDLFPKLSAKEQSEWMKLRESGRTLNEYFKQRWDNKCLTQVKCPTT